MLIFLPLIYLIEKKQILNSAIIISAAVLATAFYHIKLLSDFNVEYIIALEYSYLALYLLAIIHLSIVIIINKKGKQGENIKNFKYAAMALNPLACIIVGLFYYFKYTI